MEDALGGRALRMRSGRTFEKVLPEPLSKL